MRRLYNLLFGLFFCLSAPFYFLKMWRRGRWREGFGQRFGRFSSRTKQALTNRHVLWIHAVSVGEVNLCTQLIAALEPRLPNVKIVVSTTTSTGMAELQRHLPSHIERIYYPIDWKRWVQRAINVVRPEAVILVEAEIWPNFMWRLRERRIPVFLVNARLSARSFRGYRRAGFLFRPLFAQFAGVGAQGEADAERLLLLGCRPEAVHAVGSMKFDAARLPEKRPLDVPRLLARIGVKPGASILLGGSTHAGEEAILAEIFLRLRQHHPDLFLVLVPRHFERGKEVGRELAARGVRFLYRKSVGGSSRYQPGAIDCLLVNTTGELRHFYRHATLVFVGKSLTAHGGQNPIEPGALGKPMVFGPNMENFRSIAEAFTSRGGAVQVANALELEQTLERLLSHPEEAAELGRQAIRVVASSRGALDRTVDFITQELAHEEVYVAPRTSSA
jgi:3-deoxy-D-manno-octulosonic-acid transferase